MPSNTNPLTAEEIERMRQIVTEHDKKTSVNTFDLNNPPRQNYVHQEFPKLVYSRGEGGKPLTRKVADAEEHSDALADGWSNEPQDDHSPEPIQVDPASAAEVEAIDRQIAVARKEKAKRR